MSKQKKISAIILAAGTSSRMGSVNKLLLPINGQILIKKTIATVQASNIDELIVVLGHEAKSIKKILAPNVSKVINLDYKTGMTSSIKTGLKKINKYNDGFLIFLADQPELDTLLINQIIDYYYLNKKNQKTPIIVPAYKDKIGHPILFDISFYDQLMNHIEPKGCKGVITKNINHRIIFELDNMYKIEDLDTPEAYKKWLNKK